MCNNATLVCCWAPKLAIKCVIKHWFPCGAEGRSFSQCMVTRLPNFLGWIDFLIHGSPPKMGSVWALNERSSTVHVYKRNLAHINYNISSTLAATKLSPGTNNNNVLNYRSAKNHRYLLNSTFFRNLFFTKMCIIRAVTRNIHTQQTIILVTFHVLTIIDLSRTSILINQNYS